MEVFRRGRVAQSETAAQAWIIFILSSEHVSVCREWEERAEEDRTGVEAGRVARQLTCGLGEGGAEAT